MTADENTDVESESSTPQFYDQFVEIVSKLEGSEKSWETAWSKFDNARNQCILEVVKVSRVFKTKQS